MSSLSNILHIDLPHACDILRHMRLRRRLPGLLHDLGEIERLVSASHSPIEHKLKGLPGGGVRLKIDFAYSDGAKEHTSQEGTFTLDVTAAGKAVCEINGYNPKTMHISGKPKEAAKYLADIITWEINYPCRRPEFHLHGNFSVAQAS